MKNLISFGVKPWWAVRWETVEPEPEEPVYTDEETVYNEPTINDIIDTEMGHDYSR